MISRKDFIVETLVPYLEEHANDPAVPELERQ